MFWNNKKIKTHKLLIGEVSNHTLKHNNNMIKKEYERLIKEKEKALKHLNLTIFDDIKNGIRSYIYSLDGKYVKIEFKTGYRILSKLGEKRAEKIFNSLNLPADVAKDKELYDEIAKLKAEKEEVVWV